MNNDEFLKKCNMKGAKAIAKRHPHPVLLAPFPSLFSWFFLPPIKLRRKRMILRFMRPPSLLDK